jgi:hypothetical protein
MTGNYRICDLFWGLEPKCFIVSDPGLSPKLRYLKFLLRVYVFKSGLWFRIHFIRIRLNTDPDSDPIRIRIQSGSRA